MCSVVAIQRGLILTVVLVMEIVCELDGWRDGNFSLALRLVIRILYA